MDQELPNPKHRKAGVAILVGYAVVCLLGNAGLVFVVENIRTGQETLLFVAMWILLGLVMSQGALLTIWLNLGDDRLGKRSLLFVLGLIAGLASWMSAYLANLDTGLSLANNNISNLYLLGLLPVFLLGFAIPLLGVRVLWGRRLVQTGFAPLRSDSNRNRFSIATLMWLTTMVAAVGGAVEIMRFGMDDRSDSRWFAAGIGLAISTACSLFGILPITIVLLRQQGLRVVLPIVIIASAVTGLIVALTFHFINEGGIVSYFPRSSDEAAAAGVIAFLMLLGTTIGLVGIHWLGYRLAKA